MNNPSYPPLNLRGGKGGVMRRGKAQTKAVRTKSKDFEGKPAPRFYNQLHFTF